ncbi:hypothetical protein ACFE04_006404 [Oxalis oulophora]
MEKVQTPTAKIPASLESEESEEAYPREEDPTQKKAKIDDLVIVAEDPKLKLRRSKMLRQLILVGPLLVDSDASPDACDLRAPSSPIGMAVEKEIVVSSSPDEVVAN